MNTDITGSLQPILPDADAWQAITTIVQPLLDSASLLTLVMLVAEAPAGATDDTLHDLKAGMDEVERLLSLCLRRADRVLRCTERSCAAILFGAEAKGALCALDRFRSRLNDWGELAFPLQVGLSSAPCEATTLPDLLALAVNWRFRLWTTGDEILLLPLLPETGQDLSLKLLRPAEEHSPHSADAVVTFPPKRAARSMAETETLHRASPHLGKAGGVAHRSEMVARARARALGVPYLPPPHHIPSSVRSLLPLEVMRQLQCLPIGRDRNALTVALADPTDRGALLRLEEITGLAIFPVMTDLDALKALAHPARPRRADQMAAQPTNGSRHR